MRPHSPLRPWEGKHFTTEEHRRHLDCERLIRWYFAPEDQEMAAWVAWNVSRMEPLAFHRTDPTGIGLFNLTVEECGLGPGDEWLLQNPIRNVAAALRLFYKRGWERWDVPPLPTLPIDPDP